MKTLRLHPEDNVAVALQPLVAGTVVDKNIVAQTDIPGMHKIAMQAIDAGQTIYKYQQPIGVASVDIPAGGHIHVHNCEIAHVSRDVCAGTEASPTQYFDGDQQSTFEGYRRSDGRVGTRNFVGVLTSVNCSATVARQIVAEVERSRVLSDYPNVDGVVALTHGSGCGMQSAGEGFDVLQRTLSGYAQHPNFGGVLVVGLGCEVMQLDSIDGGCGDLPSIRKLSIQEAGGTRQSVQKGFGIVTELLTLANRCGRTITPASELTLALQCGGSDAYSGITANPSLGVAADLIIRNGGSAILSETPEIYGAEHLLMQRAVSADVAASLQERVRWWRDYAERYGDNLNSNPSPGNIAGGITTILEKSLGAQAKSGSTNLNAVLHYAERVTQKGLNFMDSPGFDPASVTGQVAAGANVICFTTGRGSAFGFKPVPSIKLATNTPLYEKMLDDMDLNCGTVADRQETVDECGGRIFQAILDTASGRKTCSEELGYGDNEFTPWQLGGVY